MAREFHQQGIDADLEDDLIQLVRLAAREDLNRSFDLTTVATVPPDLQATAHIVARDDGTAAGLDLVSKICSELDSTIAVTQHVRDAASFSAGTQLCTLSGNARDILTSERIILNFLGRLCGIATWTKLHARELENTKTRLYDTRKTTPGWRRLEKYATRCGGAHNHRSGLYEAVMIKDNHLACHATSTGKLLSPDAAVQFVRSFLAETPGMPSDVIVEIEVDTLEQLEAALPASPDIVLLDNMSSSDLASAVALRNQHNPDVELEASGGVSLDSLASIAATGVERVSLGALTHSARNLDLGLDWQIGSD